MTSKAEREAAYQALVKLGVPIPPEEIDAVLEAAEGARGTTRDAEIERLRGQLEKAAVLLSATMPRLSRLHVQSNGKFGAGHLFEAVRALLSTLSHPGKETA